ncbi:cytoskeleton protein RodZ [Pasteurella testudinis DSM 23072]|uniref:Cytoskeleton protein RodZ n=1 Tax=Pasteurella testudinis DSM 23072 TaxID=1122938 RepID=A0A1W1UIH7_9PAST|nr:RodZ family helix-turn-helix domain-containing protein [Pasteurella testudinis]SMB80574.1 cytoskeleton protein RodZ [Pasteurella testudinis DSM 23072]SUB51925.1 transmembrane protein [Pasteurella testudinis]
MENKQQHKQQQQNEFNANEFNLGETLRQKRQQLGLSVEEVVQKTHLKTAIIHQIENNELIQPNCPPTFMKGYVRNYAKFLKLPESVWNNPAISYGEPIQNDLQKNMRNNHRVNHYASYSNWIGRLTWVIALIMVGMTAYWWWQNYQQSQDERTNLVESFLNNSQSESAVSASNSSADSVLLPTPTAMENNTAPDALGTETVDSGAGSASVGLNAANADNSAIGQSGTLSALTASEANVVLTPLADNGMQNESAVTYQGQAYQGQTSGQVLSNAMEQLDGGSATANAENGDQSAVGDNIAAIAGNGLTIEIIGNSCWLSVRDANRKVLAQKEYKQGEVLNFADGEPYSLVIGAPQNVRITFQGQEVPLTIDGRVARIKLPN